MRCLHCVEHGIYEGFRDVLMKKVTHRVYKDALRLLPTERLGQTLGSKCQIKPIFEGMTGNTSKPL
jgi:hypothetical protein